MNTVKQNINITGTKKRVLVAPLDWGLGHATRCIPIIEELLIQGFEVFIAAEKGCAALLRKEFPDLPILPLPGYRITYSAAESFFFIKMIFQIPKITAAISKERRWLQSVIKEYSIDIVISDNRFGLYSKAAHTIFITHQLNIKTGNRFTESPAGKINYKYINRFDECWVPDEPGEENLGGALSHPVDMPRTPVKYIGSLSRFEKEDSEESIDLLVMVSGPEPQRTIFENNIMAQICSLNYKTVLVRGLPAAASFVGKKISDFVTVYDHLPGKELGKLISSAKIVIARSGYTTIMELASLQKKAILVPTPGQKEQEYLAEYLSGKNYCVTINQNEFDLRIAVEKLDNTKNIEFPAPCKKISAAVRSLI